MAVLDDVLSFAYGANRIREEQEEPDGGGFHRWSLHDASAAGDVAGIHAFARESAFNEHNEDGWTPLHLAVWVGQDHAVGALIAGGARVNVRSRCASTCDGCTPLHLAVAGGHGRIVARLLAAGADPNARDECGYTPLHLAAELGQADLVKRLILAGASVDALVAEETPLGLALRERRMQVVGLLRQVGART